MIAASLKAVRPSARLNLFKETTIPHTLIMDFNGLFSTLRPPFSPSGSLGAQTVAPLDFRATVSLLQDCKERGHKIFSLTELPSAFFEFLKHAPQTSLLFSYFDDILCSDLFNLKKSDPLLIEQFLTLHAIDPQSCIMVDDQPLVLRSAAHVGIQRTVLFDCSDISAVRLALTRYGML